MSNPLIQVQNLCKTYSNEGVETRALSGATFEIQKGEFISIMGPSGSGKSTLMQILGFLDRPTEGKYFFEGQDIASFDDDTLARIRNKKVGFVFQSFNLLSRTSVFENVELPLLYDSPPHQFPKEEKRIKKACGWRSFLNWCEGEKPSQYNEKKVMDALNAVGMEHRANYFSNQLSGGEKQRVAIARALVNDPEVIFADEPTGNLDSKSGLQVMRILQKLNNSGHTVILVTHETYTAEHAKRIIYVKDGNIIADDPVKNRRIADGEDRLLK
ncbi:MAG: ABC transporter ATP-binding protein [Candidatus Moranbacteria bacterium]|nr:ABC transporter ATP-binding protein [Candidatus Moranbacteria bacterium]